MEKKDVFGWIHQRQAKNISEMDEGELLIYYITRRASGADQANTGPSNLLNILTEDRFSELGIDLSQLSKMSEVEIKKIAYEKLLKKNL